MARNGKRWTGVVPLLWATALLYAPVASALGLGRLVVESGLGQPLRAEIPLFAVTPADIQAMKVRMGSAAAFAQAGIEKTHAVRAIHAKVHRSADGRYVVLLQSRRVIDAPFLHFILKVQSPEGTMMRAYMAFLNPVGGVVPLSMQPVRSQRPSAPVARIVPTARQAPAVIQPLVAPVSAGALLHPVRSGETLWTIAQRVTPNAQALPQTLEAFLQSNPQAFFNHNANDLKAGAVLRVPSRRAILAISPTQAGQWLVAQNRAWRRYRAGLAQMPSATGTSGSVGISGALRSAQIISAHRQFLKIEPANLGMDTVAAGAGKGTVTKAKLVAQVAELQRELQDTKRLIVLDDRELASLEHPVKAPVVTKGAIPSRISELPKGVAKPMPAVHVTPAHPLDLHKAPIVVRPQPVVPAPSFLGMLMSMGRLPLMGGVAIILLGIGFFVYRRRQQSMVEFEESILSGGGLNSEGQMADTGNLAKTPEVSFMSEFSQGTNGVVNMHTDEVDPIAEADVYLAYGRDEQAEEILKDALTKDSQRLELKLKLLDIYFARHDVKTFEIIAEELYAAVDGKGPMWQKVEEMGQRLDPANPLFKRGSQGADDGSSRDRVPPPVADRIDFAAVARELDEVSAPRAAPVNPVVEPFPLNAPLGESNDLEDNVIDFTVDPLAEGLTLPGGSGNQDSTDMTTKPGSKLDFSWGETSSTAAPPADEFALQFDDEDLMDLQGAQESGRAVNGAAAKTIDFSPSFADDAKTHEGASFMETEREPIDAHAVETKLDLARAYLEMGDQEGARSLLDEVQVEGSEQQRAQGQKLAAQLV